MNILVVAAHPDDEVLGCGGTIKRWAEEKQDVYIAILGEGISSRYQEREQADRAIIEALHSQCVEVAKILGARDLFMYDLPDNRFDTVPFLDITKKIENLVARISPGVIYTHHNGDLNLDHVLVHRAVLTATRPIKGYPVKEIYAFEVPSSTDWSFQRLEPNFRPNVFVDISQTLEAKMKAISIYETEIRDFPHPRSMEAIRASATRWGSVAGCIAAEAFELVRLIK